MLVFICENCGSKENKNWDCCDKASYLAHVERKGRLELFTKDPLIQQWEEQEYLAKRMGLR